MVRWCCVDICISQHNNTSTQQHLYNISTQHLNIISQHLNTSPQQHLYNTST
ncbi:MAG: hypothetical protein SO138_06175 [Prevotella sp.]|nr:hypothetical protein [Prevotella sp.]MCI6717553.1 hypothetical protein [Prevotella sp.]MDY3704470.1 hypothetical protein [Prevotella sp.]